MPCQRTRSTPPVVPTSRTRVSYSGHTAWQRGWRDLRALTFHVRASRRPASLRLVLVRRGESSRGASRDVEMQGHRIVRDGGASGAVHTVYSFFSRMRVGALSNLSPSRGASHSRPWRHIPINNLQTAIASPKKTLHPARRMHREHRASRRRVRRVFTLLPPTAASIHASFTTPGPRRHVCSQNTRVVLLSEPACRNLRRRRESACEATCGLHGRGMRVHSMGRSFESGFECFRHDVEFVAFFRCLFHRFFRRCAGVRFACVGTWSAPVRWPAVNIPYTM